MADIPLSDALLLWNFRDDEAEPKFAVRPLGHPDYDEYDCQGGACYRVWHEFTADQRRTRMLVDIWHISTFYDVPPRMIHEEMLAIPEYRDTLADDRLPRRFQGERA